MRSTRLIGATSALAFVAALAGLGTRAGATITAPAFNAPTRLPSWNGGEPSLAFDPAGNAIYVTAPQNVPAVLNKPITTFYSTLDANYPGPGQSSDKGVGFWASMDGGKTWTRTANIGNTLGGGDSDVVAGPDHTVYIADMEAWATTICTSSNYGASFTSSGLPADTCQTVTTDQQGPIVDRPWLTLGRAGEMYLTYHDLVTGFPLVLKSTDKAKTFTPCGSMLDPQGPAAANFSPEQGTLVSKPFTWRDNSLFATVGEPDRGPTGAAINHLYLAHSPANCGPSSVWKNTTIYTNPGANFSLFQSGAIDGGGVLYVVAAGQTAANQPSNIWLFVSRDAGAHWSSPIRVNPTWLKGNAMPAIVGGYRGNQLAIGWYGTRVSGDPGYAHNTWQYYAATSFDAGKTFKLATVTPSIIHYGDICMDGALCGSSTDGPSNRNLADFSSIALSPKTGCVVVAFGGDPWNRPDIDAARDSFTSAAYVATQRSGTCLK